MYGDLLESSYHYLEQELRAGLDYAQVERRSVTFLDQTMSRGEAFGLKKYIKIIHLKLLAGHSVKPQRTSPKAKPHTICKNLKSEICLFHLTVQILSDFEYFNEKKVRPLDGSLGRAFCSTQTLLERPNSWRHNFLKVLPPRLFWRRCPLDFGL